MTVSQHPAPSAASAPAVSGITKGGPSVSVKGCRARHRPVEPSASATGQRGRG